MKKFSTTRTKETAMNLGFQVENVTLPNKPNIHVTGYIDTYSGYSNHCRNAVDGLNSTGKYNLKLSALKTISDVDPTITSKYKNNIHMDKFNYEESIHLSITAPGYMQKDLLPDCKKSFSWTMTETNQVPRDIVKLTSNVDTIICPTIIDKDKFVKAGVKNAVVCPIGYNQKLYNKETPRLDISNLRGRYVFGVVGSWNARKNQKAIVKAFIKTYKASSQVTLLICGKYATSRYAEDEDRKWDIRSELKEIIRQTGVNEKDLPHIAIMDEPVHESVMPLLMSRIDCLVGLSTGESTWLPGLEMAAIGRPVIQLVNPYAGYMEYLIDNPYMCNLYSVRTVEEEFHKGISCYYKDQKMCFGKVDELSDMMKKVHLERDSNIQKSVIDDVRNRVRARTWKDSNIKLMDILEIR